MKYGLKYVLAAFFLVVVILTLMAYLIFKSVDMTKTIETLIPTLATILTAAVAILIYMWQQEKQIQKIKDNTNDEISRLSSAIYREITHAENAIAIIKNRNLEKKQQACNINNGVVSFALINETAPLILSRDTWTDKKNLFIGLLSMEHFDQIDKAFEMAIQAEDCRRWAIELFRNQVQQKADVRIRAISNITEDLVYEAYFNSTSSYKNEYDALQAIRKIYLDINDLPSSLFFPQELGNLGEEALMKFKGIVNTPAGEALKVLSGIYKR